MELSPGQELDLVTAGGEPVTRLTMGVGWDKAPNAGFIASGAPEIDLDASAIEFSGRRAFDYAFYNNLRTRDGSVVHQGDNQSGKGTGDDEAITVDLAAVHPQIDSVVFLVSSYQGHTLEWIDRAYCRLVADDESEIARLTLTGGIAATGVALGRLHRAGDGWRFRAIGEGIDVTVPTQATDALIPHL